MASPEATTRTNHDQMTPESTPGPDADRLAADKERQKTQAAPTSHGGDDSAFPLSCSTPGFFQLKRSRSAEPAARPSPSLSGHVLFLFDLAAVSL